MVCNRPKAQGITSIDRREAPVRCSRGKYILIHDWVSLHMSTIVAWAHCFLAGRWG